MGCCWELAECNGLQNAGIIPVVNLSGVDECELILICIVPEKCVVVKLAFSHDWHAIKRAVKHSSKKRLYQRNIAASIPFSVYNHIKVNAMYFMVFLLFREERRSHLEFSMYLFSSYSLSRKSCLLQGCGFHSTSWRKVPCPVDCQPRRCFLTLWHQGLLPKGHLAWYTGQGGSLGPTPGSQGQHKTGATLPARCKFPPGQLSQEGPGEGLLPQSQLSGDERAGQAWERVGGCWEKAEKQGLWPEELRRSSPPAPGAGGHLWVLWECPSISEQRASG